MTTTTTLIKTVVAAATATTAFTAAATSLSSFSTNNNKQSPSSSFSLFSKSPDFRRLFVSHKPKSLVPVINSVSTLAPLHMDSQENLPLPELMTEFMVDMKCEGCVSAVKNKLESLDGVKNVEADLSDQVVRILGTSAVKAMQEALEQTGRTAKLIGQGVPEDFLVSAAVAEFKGPDIFGVVRFAQANMELARIEANFSGLSPGKHGWSINEFGDLTRGPASTGKMYNPPVQGGEKEPLGDLGTFEANEKGEAYYSGVKKMLRVVDLIGRSIVLYTTEDKSDPGLAAAVIARSAGVGENYKKLCTCDGTTIWEATPDFVTSKV